MDAQQQSQLAQSNAAKQAAPLTAEQAQQRQQMEAAMKAQQEQLQAHINQQIQAAVTAYNLDVQRVTIAAQGLEALFKVITSPDVYAETSMEIGSILLDTAKQLGLKLKALINPDKTPVVDNVSCETSAITNEEDDVNSRIKYHNLNS